jgi:hypothetical protein
MNMDRAMGFLTPLAQSALYASVAKALAVLAEKECGVVIFYEGESYG